MILTKKEIFWIMLIVVIAFLIRFSFFSLHQVVELDGAYYISLGENLVEKGSYSDMENNLNTNLTPGMPIAVGLLNLLIKDGVLSSRLINAIFGSLLIIPVYLFTKRIFNRKEAYIAAILTASYTILIYSSTLTYNDSLYSFLFLFGLYFGWLGLNKEKLWMYILAGVLFGISALVRPESGLVVVVFIFYSLIAFRNFSLKRFFNILSLIIVFVLVISPWVLFVHENTGKWQMSTRGAFTYLHREFEIFTDDYERNQFSLSIDKTRIRLNPYNFTGDTSPFTYILQEPEKFATRYLNNFGDFLFKFITEIFPIIFLFIVIYGLYGKQNLKADIYLLLFIIYPFFLYPVYGSESRWFIPLIPILLIWVSRGITKLEERKKYFNVYIITLLISILMIVAVLFVNPLTPKIYEKNDQPIEQKIAGEWLKNNVGEGKIIMSRRPWVSFYSKGRYVYLPYADYEDTIEYACNNKVDYLVADSRYLEKLRPQLKFLLNEDFKDLDLVYKNEVNGKIVKIFKMKC
jgi:4-amino-4-deoxy-L-arabinose transferase-like glycosyltransferase